MTDKNKAALDALEEVKDDFYFDYIGLMEHYETIRKALTNDPDTVTIKRSEVEKILGFLKFTYIHHKYDEHIKILETALGEKKK